MYKEQVERIPMAEYHAVIDSTNIRAKELAREGAPEGTMVFADEQTAGRGRLKRQWISKPASGIWTTCICRPNGLPAQRSPELSFLAGLAAAEAIEEVCSVHVDMKWPNDLLVDGCKICGILAESGLDTSGCVQWSVIGIGINVHGDVDPSLPYARSLEVASGCRCGRGDLAEALARVLRFRMAQWKTEGFGVILEACRKRMITLGKEVQAERDGDILRGTAVDLAEDGSLILRCVDGKMEYLTFGEVSVRGIMGYAQ